MAKTPLPANTSLEDVKLRIKETYSNPNVGRVEQVWLKEGPRVFRVATLLEILDPKVGKRHHYSLKLDTLNRTTKVGWFSKAEQSIRIEGKPEDDEIERLFSFLAAHREGIFDGKTGNLRIVSSEQYYQLEKFLTVLPNFASIDRLNIVKTILSQFDSNISNVQDFLSAFQYSEGTTLRHIAVASRVVEYKKAFEVMKSMIENNQINESEIQKHLTANPWMFGSEYSELLDRRTWTRDNRLDFMLRRSVDGYLEVVEIKTPFQEDLLVYDKSHDSYSPCSKLSQVIGQVVKYIEEVNRDRDKIIAKDKCDALKVCARIIVGRDGNENMMAALRSFNSHLHGIEIITFDQLMRIAKRVLSVFDNEISPSKNIPSLNAVEKEDLPF